MSIISKGRLIALGGVAAIVAYSFADRAINYTETDASITSIKVDCYVESRKKKVVDKTTGDMAYMDCAMAPSVAVHFGHSESDVKKRASITFEYTSPVDGSRQTGEHVDSYYNGNHKPGEHVTVYAHTSEPAKSRWF